jgi:hypothetical protein
MGLANLAGPLDELVVVLAGDVKESRLLEDAFRRRGAVVELADLEPLGTESPHDGRPGFARPEDAPDGPRSGGGRRKGRPLRTRGSLAYRVTEPDFGSILDYSLPCVADEADFPAECRDALWRHAATLPVRSLGEYLALGREARRLLAEQSPKLDPGMLQQIDAALRAFVARPSVRQVISETRRDLAPEFAHLVRGGSAEFARPVRGGSAEFAQLVRGGPAQGRRRSGHAIGPVGPGPAGPRVAKVLRRSARPKGGRSRASAWDRLIELLAGTDADQVVLSLEQIEHLRGSRLPETARRGRKYWCGNKQEWVKVGFRARVSGPGVGPGEVAFVRIGAGDRVMRRGCSWDGLVAVLANFEGDCLSATFREIEEWRGWPLPEGARKRRDFWTADTNPWFRLGFRAHIGKLATERVDFVRFAW